VALYVVQFLVLDVVKFLLIEHNALIISVQFFVVFNLAIALSWGMELLA
jgi:hypothetical protein